MAIEAGHEITVDWTRHEFTETGVVGGPDKLSEFAQEDLMGVMLADRIVILAVHSFHYKGTLVEMGVALGQNKSVHVIGNGIDSCIFMNHPLVRRNSSISDVLLDLQLASVVELASVEELE